jgi:dipeptidyl aminopeptidase/acylaminoacyl peptidase
MRAHGSIAILALLVACMTGVPARARPGQEQPDTPFGVGDLVRLARLSEAAVSADGKRVAYTLRTTDMDANKGRKAIWMVEPRKRNASPVRLTPLESDSNSPEWGGDGLYFLSNRSGSMQVWRLVIGGEPKQVTDLPLEVGSFRVSAGGDRLLVTVEVFRDCATLTCSKERLEVLAHDRGRGVVYDKLFVRHWDTWSDGRRSQLFSIPLDPSGNSAGAPLNLTAGIDGDVPSKPFGGREDYALSADGQQVAFSVRAAPDEAWSTNFDIYLVPAGGGTARNMTAENSAADVQPAFSPDGKQLAYLAMERPGFEADRLQLVLLELKTGAKRPLTRGWDRSIEAFEWARDGKMLFATADHLGQRPLWSIDAGTGRTAAITGDGDVEGFSVGAKEVFYAQSSLGSPADLYSVPFDGGKTRQLTRVNQQELSGRRLGEYQQFNFAGANGDNVFAYVVKPANFRRDQKYPVALLIHGGPQGSMANVWHWRWNAQVFAGAGYGVVMIDFHGSTGYGQAFTDSISGDWGGKPLEDLKIGLAAAVRQFPWLDGDDACALGGSYGGFMINWIAGQWPDRFKCLVSHDGIFDQRSMYYSTEELWFPEWENGGPEYANPAAYAKFNPVSDVTRWKTPMLVIHGQQDYRVPYTQGLAVFTALQRRGVPSELLYFPDENHWVLKPANSIQWYDTVIGWMNRWTRH